MQISTCLRGGPCRLNSARRLCKGCIRKITTKSDSGIFKMVLSIFSRFRDCKFIFLAAIASLFILFFSMDIVLYRTLQSTTLIKESNTHYNKVHSPFHPLSFKLLTLDHYSHYLIKPSCEFFNYITDFSNIFYFVTPNMISAFHVCVGLVVGKYVTSENIQHRRFGAFLYEARTWIDGLDGVVYRSRKGEVRYSAQGNYIGSQIDNVCDIIGGIVLSFSVLFFLFKRYHNTYNILPPWWSSTTSNSTLNGHLSNGLLPVSVVKKGALTNGVNKYKDHNGNGFVGHVPSKFAIFMKVLLLGTLVSVAGRTWEITVTRAENLFEKPMAAPELTIIQTAMLHSSVTWWICWSWRLLGQMFFHYLCIAIVIDKIWEYLSFIVYFGFAAIITLDIISYCYLNQVQTLLQL